jgi:hypothetical protein
MNWSLMNNGAYDYAANTRVIPPTYSEYYTPGGFFAGTSLMPIE